MTIRFGTDGWRAVIADEFTFDAVRRVARAFSAVVRRESDQNRPVVTVGYDRRFESDEFARVATETLVTHGIDVRLSRFPIPSPVLSFSTMESSSFAGLMVTASHNPAIFNGIKLKGGRGGAAPTSMLRAVEAELAGRSSGRSTRNYGQVTEIDPLPTYLERIGRLVDLNAIRNTGLTIVVDAMYGCGAGLLPRLLGEHATQIIEINTAHNPLFPGITGPEPVERNLERLKKVVGDGGANIGIGFDGDADRIGVVTEQGEYLSAQHVFALLTRYVLQYRDRSSAIAKSVTGSAMIDMIGDQASVPVIETATGFTHISQAMIDEGASIGGEESGGFAFGFHIPDRDGALAALLLIDYTLKTGKKLSELVSEMESAIGTWRYRRVDLPLTREDRASLEQRIHETSWPATMANLAVANVVQVDGTRIEFTDGSRVLIRGSGTEPLLRLYAEAHDSETVDALLLSVRGVLGV